MNRLFFFFFLFVYIPCASSQSNRALLVMVGEYPEDSGWGYIHATNDARIVVPMLLRNGYEEKNITLLLDKKATKERVIRELKKLHEAAAPGDGIYIHFSCHGQQMTDDNGDEEDGLDEALIPYDAVYRFRKGAYEGENHLRDDELGNWLDNIRTRITTTGQVTVVLDACHSGTGTREGDDEFIRGTAYVFATPGHPVASKKTTPVRLLTQEKRNLAPMTVFSACQPHEVNSEYKEEQRQRYYGTLSYALCTVLTQWNGALTLREFQKKLESEIQRMQANKRMKQTPYIESTTYESRFSIEKHTH